MGDVERRHQARMKELQKRADDRNRREATAKKAREDTRKKYPTEGTSVCS